MIGIKDISIARGPPFVVQTRGINNFDIAVILQQLQAGDNVVYPLKLPALADTPYIIRAHFMGRLLFFKLLEYVFSSASRFARAVTPLLQYNAVFGQASLSVVLLHVFRFNYFATDCSTVANSLIPFVKYPISTCSFIRYFFPAFKCGSSPEMHISLIRHFDNPGARSAVSLIVSILVEAVWLILIPP